MQYTYRYNSPLGGILLAADDAGLTGLWFDGQKYFARTLAAQREEKDAPVLRQTARWLDDYFSRRVPAAPPPLHMVGTPFQLAVWAMLAKIPYGETVSYGELARQLAAQAGLSGISAQAVGGAVGRNPISIIVPCHRVVGAGGKLTGYAGGIDRKRALLAMERESAFLPQK